MGSGAGGAVGEEGGGDAMGEEGEGDAMGGEGEGGGDFFSSFPFSFFLLQVLKGKKVFISDTMILNHEFAPYPLLMSTF